MEPTSDTQRTDGTGHDRHPLQLCGDAIGAALKDVAGINPLFAPVEAKRETLLSLTRLGDQVESLRMSVMANAGDVAEAEAARSIAAWLAPKVLTQRETQSKAEKLACDLHSHYPVLREALSTAHANIHQTRVIARSLNELRRLEEVTTKILDTAEEFLVAQCAHLTPAELKILADGVLEHLDPDVFTDAERKKLESDLKKARSETRMTMRKRGDGSTDVSIRIPDSLALRLKTYLEAHTSPRHDSNRNSFEQRDSGSLADGAVASRYRDPATGERLPQERLMGEAFCAFLERYDPNQMPKHGGMATTLVITTDYDALTQRLGPGTLPDGSRLAAGDLRRLACNAKIIPAVLGDNSAVLDLGTTRRLFSVEQRIAAGIAHPTCQASGCTIPSTWCEAHHRTPWSQGGNTDLDNAMLLCNFHHQRIHDDSYLVKELSNGDVRFATRR
ncbi:MAG: HNH endonuclease [Nocardioides sp.]|nr:HNH endonuclease [Nocardioides sp.]